ncbi:hypothetical protein ADUPG1_008075 [Aduncisulcus paluster]|uniref:Protein kinase domain-containing protein n=1 Tax=Aduncisulcus paluster TaxID=2918883 RepID=A0ABQ5KQM4_9EUKA|nr:hypothetical protein ADUPG1_008075 [Aduncisulcus paluster]
MSDQFIFESLVFKSPESFDGIETQKSDAYSLGLTLFSLFFGCTPFTQMQAYEGLDSVEAFYKRLIEKRCKLSLSDSYVFRKLKTMEEGKYKHLHTCFEEIIYGLIRFNPAERMSVHEACERVQSIKELLPSLGAGYKLPRPEDIVGANLDRYGLPGNIRSDESVISEHHCDCKETFGESLDHAVRHYDHPSIFVKVHNHIVERRIDSDETKIVHHSFDKKGDSRKEDSEEEEKE